MNHLFVPRIQEDCVTRTKDRLRFTRYVAGSPSSTTDFEVAFDYSESARYKASILCPDSVGEELLTLYHISYKQGTPGAPLVFTIHSYEGDVKSHVETSQTDDGHIKLKPHHALSAFHPRYVTHGWMNKTEAVLESCGGIKNIRLEITPQSRTEDLIEHDWHECKVTFRHRINVEPSGYDVAILTVLDLAALLHKLH